MTVKIHYNHEETAEFITEIAERHGARIDKNEAWMLIHFESDAARGDFMRDLRTYGQPAQV